MAKGKNILTTGNIATICSVASRTVTTWLDKGLLKGYKLPGSNTRRVTIKEMERFLQENGMPMPPFLDWLSEQKAKNEEK